MSPSPLISVILCAFNPRPDYLEATLASLRRQDLSVGEWELIVIDNNSSLPLAGILDLSWHPSARVVVETSQGLAKARRRGYLEARGHLIVNSDDDNVLAPDYLSRARDIFQAKPHIGTFGGQLVPRFEVEPRTALERSFGEERRLEADRWSNLIDDTRCMPWGAGMCIRREVAEGYLRETEADPRRLMLGRTGNRLLTGEDLDVNYVAVKLGFGTGLFRALSLEHFIPAKHLDPAHHIRYKGEANGYSVTLLKFLHFGVLGPRPLTRLGRCRRWLQRRRMSHFERRRAEAWDRGVAAAVADIRRWGWTASDKPLHDPR
jgi:glycosyltransferase involved in cell wall biosynthesis